MQRDTDNPYQAPEVMYEPSQGPVRDSGLRLLRRLLGLQLVTLAIGLCLATVHIESIVATGPLMSIVGILVAGVSLKKRVVTGICAGVSAPVFSLVIFLTINLLDWRPSDARLPVPIMGLLYAVVLVALAVGVRFQLKAREADMEPIDAKESQDLTRF